MDTNRILAEMGLPGTVQSLEVPIARKKLKEIARNIIVAKRGFINNSILIQVPMGIGKTHAFLEVMINEAPEEKRFIFAAPTRELAKDVCQRALNMGMDKKEYILFFGKQPDECLKDPVKLKEAFDARVDANDLFCRNCEEMCRYKQELMEARNKRIIFTTHQMAASLGHAIPNSMVIYDETPNKAQEGISFSLAEISTLRHEIEKQRGNPLPMTKKFLNGVFDGLKRKNGDVIVHTGPFWMQGLYSWGRFLKEHQLEGKALMAQREWKKAKITTSKSLYNKTGLLLPESLIGFMQGKIRGPFVLVKDAINNEISLVVFDHRTPIYQPCVILDATPIVDDMPGTLDIIRIPYKAKYDMYFHPTTQSKGATKEKSRMDSHTWRMIRRFLEAQAAGCENILLISKKDFTEKQWLQIRKLEMAMEPARLHVRHLGDIRGLDTYGQMDMGIILLNHYVPRVQTIAATIEALRIHGYITVMDKMMRHVETKEQEKAIETLFAYHVTYTITRLHVSELIQAAGRIRPIDPKGQPRYPKLFVAADPFVLAAYYMEYMQGDIQRTIWLFGAGAIDYLALMSTREWIRAGMPKRLKNEQHREILTFLKEQVETCESALEKAIEENKNKKVIKELKFALYNARSRLRQYIRCTKTLMYQ